MSLRALRFLNERSALPVAVCAVGIAAVGDVLTGAEVTFTLVYLLPIAIASWFRGRKAGIWITAICMVAAAVTGAITDPHLSNRIVLAWNLCATATIFLVYADIMARLRDRLQTETQLRLSALEELRHADRLNTIGKLAAGMAHELGTPLNVIAGRAELIASGRVEPEGVRASASVIVQQAERMTTIIRNMLDFGRRGGTQTRKESVLTVCEDTAHLLRSLAKQRGVEIGVSGDDVEARVNRAEVQQVLSNLVSNAVHAMPNGGTVRMSVASVRARLPEADDEKERDYVLVSVRDDGTGISPEVLPRIFEPFFTTKAPGEGSGLGLSVAYGIIRDHGGVIRVQSAVGEGTCMLVYLPR